MVLDEETSHMEPMTRTACGGDLYNLFKVFVPGGSRGHSFLRSACLPFVFPVLPFTPTFTLCRSSRAMSVLPLRYYAPNAATYDASSGRDLLRVSGNVVRPAIGGKRRSRKTHRTRKQKAGFVPSVMEGFCAATSKYVVPLALFAIHSLVRKGTQKGRKGKKGTKSTRRGKKRI